MQRHFQTSDELCRYVAERSPEVVLSFSCGKDAIAAWIQLRRFFKRIVPVYLYLVPGLGFVERSLAYYEKTFGTPILRLPNPNLYRMLNNFIFQPPERCHVIEGLKLTEPSRDDLNREAKRMGGLPATAFTALGVRASDSILRRRSTSKHGTLNPGKRTFFPVFDWSVEMVSQALRTEGIDLPVDYQMFGRTFDGIFDQYLRPVKVRFPEDYAKILAWFPLADMETMRIEKRRQYGR